MRAHGFIILIALLSACTSMRSTPIDEPSTLEGLTRVDVKGVDAVYKKPEADLSKYNKLLIRPVEISFSRNWERNQDSAMHTMVPADRERIKRDLAALFAEVSKRELETEGKYELVSETGSDVLEVVPAIIDLYITAPDVSRDSAVNVKSYTANAGSMTLIAELRDSVTGELLSRAYDQRDDQNDMMWQWTTSVTNSAEAKRIIASWADSLRAALDASRTRPT